MNIRVGKRTIFLPFVLILLSCRHDPEIPISPVFTFDKDVSAITLNNCATIGCHDGTSKRRPLITYADVMHYVSAGKPYDSKLFTEIIKLSGSKMPPAGPLSDPQIKTIYVWILQGSKEN